MTPRPTAKVHGDHPGRQRRQDVVVDPVPDVRDLPRRASRLLRQEREEPR
jgi:hypothetical protein